MLFPFLQISSIVPVHFAPKPPRNITNEQSPYWLLFTPCPVTRFAMHRNHAKHDFAPQFSGFL